nr:hypothetical protein [Tanacetum cinerariifolium]
YKACLVVGVAVVGSFGYINSKRGVCFWVQQQPRVLLIVRVSTTVHSAVPSTTRVCLVYSAEVGVLVYAPTEDAFRFICTKGAFGLQPSRKTCNNDKNLNEIQLEHEKEDELVAILVKVVYELDCIMVVKEIENEIFEEFEKLEWWFEQDIDDEGEEDEEDGGGDEI